MKERLDGTVFWENMGLDLNSCDLQGHIAGTAVLRIHAVTSPSVHLISCPISGVCYIKKSGNTQLKNLYPVHPSAVSDSSAINIPCRLLAIGYYSGKMDNFTSFTVRHRLI